MGTIVAIGVLEGRRVITIQLEANHLVEPVHETVNAFRQKEVDETLFGWGSVVEFKRVAESMYGDLTWDAHYCK